MNLRLEVLRAKYPEAIRTAERRWLIASLVSCVFYISIKHHEAIDKWLESQAPEIKADDFNEPESYIYQLWIEHETKTSALYDTYQKMMLRWAKRFRDRVEVADRMADDPKYYLDEEDEPS